jgi:hypothetical protein
MRWNFVSLLQVAKNDSQTTDATPTTGLMLPSFDLITPVELLDSFHQQSGDGNNEYFYYEM